ncbi:MAG: ABC transporter ATP-binding protein [Chloroflexota bacterium]
MDHVSREFETREGQTLVALDDFTLDVPAGTFLTIVGPSGCGKSTLLNLVSGLMPASGGSLRYKGRVREGVDTSIGYVTQRDNLLPWRTLLGNVELALEVQGLPRAERQDRARQWIARVGLAGFERRYPDELSGGMRQRANIARTLIHDPDLILMDEPFGPLDALTRLSLQAELLQLWNQDRKTVVFITHDLVEAIALADRTVVMSARPGRIRLVLDVPLPRPRDVYRIHSEPAFAALYDQVWTAITAETTISGEGGPHGPAPERLKDLAVELNVST